MFRNLILSVVLLTNAFAQNAALTSSGFKGARELKTQSAFAHKVALETSGFDSAYKLSLPKPVQDKNFYLLSLTNPKVQARKTRAEAKVVRSMNFPV